MSLFGVVPTEAELEMARTFLESAKQFDVEQQIDRIDFITEILSEMISVCSSFFSNSFWL